LSGAARAPAAISAFLHELLPFSDGPHAHARRCYGPFEAQDQRAARRAKMTTPSGHTTAIRAKKVIGTKVQDTSGRKIGEVEDVMLDKQSNSIMFAVIGFGGFLVIAEK
jgi:hypothetical protein